MKYQVFYLILLKKTLNKPFFSLFFTKIFVNKIETSKFFGISFDLFLIFIGQFFFQQ
jgi:hypothetical protein